MRSLFQDLERHLLLFGGPVPGLDPAWPTRRDPRGPSRRCLPTTAGAAVAWTRAEVSQGDEAVVITVDLPGVRPEGVTVEADDDVLTIAGTRGHEGSSDLVYKRSYRLAPEIDLDHIAATLNHGVLTVTLPKTAPAPPRRIAIQSGVCDVPAADPVDLG